MIEEEMQRGLAGSNLHGRPYADVTQIQPVEPRLVEYMKALFDEHYDTKLAATLYDFMPSGQKVAPRFNRRGIEFLSVIKGTVTINNRRLGVGEMARIDPGEIVEIAACEDSELVSHIFPYNKALISQPLPRAELSASADTPLVSIVIIAKDIEHHVCQSILSGIEQSYEHIEIIVVDDGSTDSTAAKCFSMAHFDERVQVHVQSLGRNGVRKFGVQQARGQYCLIIDGDDWLNRDAIEKMVEAAQKAESECVVFGFDHVSDRSAHVWNPVYPANNHLQRQPLYKNKNDQEAFEASHLNHTIWMYFFSTRMKSKVADSLVDIDLYEDLPFYFAIMANAKNPTLWNEVLYRYRRDRVGQSTANWGQVSPARKLSSLKIAVDHCLDIIGGDKFLSLILLYKIRRIVDYELQVCTDNADTVGTTAWNNIWRTACGKFPSDISRQIVDDRLKRMFTTANK